MGTACAQNIDHELDGTWRVTSKTETEAEGDAYLNDLDHSTTTNSTTYYILGY